MVLHDHSVPNFPQNLAIRPSDIDPQFINGTKYARSFGFEGQQESIGKYGIAGRVWEAAYALTTYLDRHGTLDFDPPFIPDCNELEHQSFRIIELGSGTGIVSALMGETIARPQRDVIFATDLPEVCPLIEHNLRDLDRDVVRVRPLSWGNHEHALNILDELQKSGLEQGISHIICSDLVYFPELLGPLLRSLIQLSSPPFALSEPVTVVISYKVRSLAKETPFWSAFGTWFTFSPVLAKLRDGPHRDRWERFGSKLEGPVYVFVARRRPESFVWSVPADDWELLQGCGSRAGYDTFETLMLLSVMEEDDDDDDNEVQT
ncbi:hypothetical protein PLICRDRAFT_116434 [Plicaturopsis crispa FD-325 SS-3]|uniref:Unplaced genomic scaffold PLICRscaffold_15, whole genome shotgun sequence n=1 Tax=Plicaturopsis crispa FD-325 SS-3 TaxID=944288 RepID=A0A0C9T6Z3_PLICR|nr:hypothetical protein PLICRDRAFT_116434 [Plicaturopsis crispa FD-325 SS-3]